MNYIFHKFMVSWLIINIIGWILCSILIPSAKRLRFWWSLDSEGFRRWSSRRGFQGCFCRKECKSCFSKSIKQLLNQVELLSSETRFLFPPFPLEPNPPGFEIFRIWFQDLFSHPLHSTPCNLTLVSSDSADFLTLLLKTRNCSRSDQSMLRIMVCNPWWLKATGLCFEIILYPSWSSSWKTVVPGLLKTIPTGVPDRRKSSSLPHSGEPASEWE